MINNVEPLNSELAAELTDMGAETHWYEQDQTYFIEIVREWDVMRLVEIVRFYYPNAAVVRSLPQPENRITVCIGTVLDFILYPPNSTNDRLETIIAKEIKKEIDLEIMRALKSKLP